VHTVSATRVTYEGESGFVGAGEDASARTAALDGIRAIAILLVLVHNAGSVIGEPAGAPVKLWAVLSNGGWIGVQLFFALSGFLITRILLASKGGAGWLKSFYARRVLRIVPLYYLLLAIVFFVAPHVAALGPIAGQPTRSTLWYWSYLSNWVGPFGGMATALPHVWSLAVEEQFYLFWPLLIAALSERALGVVSVLLVVLAVIIRVVIDASFPEHVANTAAYTWTITRWDAIAMGALVAIASRHPRGAAFLRDRSMMLLGATLAGLGVVTVLGRGLSSEGFLADYFAIPLSGLLGASMVAACVAGVPTHGLRRVLVRGLASRALTTIGKYSYAIYVFHLPVHLLLRRVAEPYLSAGGSVARLGGYVGYTGAVFAVSFVLALVSWRLLEAPFLSLKSRFPMPRGA
jgi:peptidoglycan/LPS O-acetylase OafA/YrhL